METVRTANIKALSLPYVSDTLRAELLSITSSLHTQCFTRGGVISYKFINSERLLSDMNTLPSEEIWSEEHAKHVDCWVDSAQPFTEIVWVRCDDLDLLGLHQLSKTFAHRIGIREGHQRIMTIYDKGGKALLKYKPATNELVVLNDSGLYNGPIENQVLPVTKLKLETSTSVGPHQMTVVLREPTWLSSSSK